MSSVTICLFVYNLNHKFSKQKRIQVLMYRMVIKKKKLVCVKDVIIEEKTYKAGVI